MNADGIPSLRSAAKNGAVGAMEQLSEKLLDAGNRTEAEIWLRKAAALGNVHDIYNLGTALMKTNHANEGVVDLRIAAALGFVDAESALAKVLLVGKASIDKRYAGFDRYVRAADEGNLYAPVLLANLALSTADRSLDVESLVWVEVAMSAPLRNETDVLQTKAISPEKRLSDHEQDLVNTRVLEIVGRRKSR